MRFSFLLLLLLAVSSSFAQDSSPRTRLQSAGAVWRVDTEHHQAINFDDGLSFGTGDAAASALAFLTEYGPDLRINDASQFAQLGLSRGINGYRYVRFQQMRAGTQVLGGVFTIAVDPVGRVKGMAGTLLSPTSFAPASAPLYTAADYQQKATQSLIDLQPFAGQWAVTERPDAWASTYPSHPDSDNPARRCYTYDISEPAGHRAYRVYLDQATGKVVFRHQLHCDLNREAYQNNTQATSLIWSEGDAFPGSLNADAQELLRATEETYNLYRYTFGRDGYDGNDGLMRTVSSADLNNCPNATALGNTIAHCDGIATDDIVGHEWTHNYIGTMSGLIYAFESGAINEGYADIFGEVIDLLNDRGNDTGEDNLRTGCNDAGQRWQMGEDASFGALRDMWSPECRNDPSSRASGSYSCVNFNNDSGGVHSNSGLVNRAFSLLVDGGSLNGTTVSGIGLTKALHVFHHAQANYLTPATDFFALADALIASANDLAGTNLPALTLLAIAAPPSGEIISAADIGEVQNAVAATQLQGQGPCTNQPTLAENPPTPCSNAAVDEDIVLLGQDWETGLAGWTVLEVPENPTTWDAKPWALNTNLPDGRAGSGIFAPDPRVGDCITDLENGLVHLTSPLVALPLDREEFRLTFNHYYSTENGYDGGALYLSLNGAPFTYLPNSAFMFNGYDDQLVAPGGNDNPLAALETFNGADINSTSGTWGTSVVDLTAAGAMPGDDLQLRWTMSHDGCNGWLGWYLDEISVSYCNQAILPVSFTALAASATKDRIDLYWSTENEEQNNGFQVERSEESGTGFQSIGFVSASGQLSGTYDFTDLDVRPSATYYYRLRQVDTDGSERLSPVVTARTDGEGGGLTVFPNPVGDHFSFSTSSSEASVARLYDGAGRLVREISVADGTGTVDASPLAPGVYYLRVGALVRRVVR